MLSTLPYQVPQVDRKIKIRVYPLMKLHDTLNKDALIDVYYKR